MVYPNPFIRPVPSTWNYGSFTGEKPIQVASTQIAFLDITGASRRNWPPGPSSVPHYWPEASVADEVLGPRREDRTKTPSLIELALRACYKSPQLSQLPFLVPKDCPTHLTQLLKDTWKLREAGGKICSVCGREYIIPRTEWLEWWYCIPSEAIMTGDSISFQMDRKPVPLLRRGCSWACWDQNGSPLIRGWSSAVMPGGREAELEVQN